MASSVTGAAPFAPFADRELFAFGAMVKVEVVERMLGQIGRAGGEVGEGTTSAASGLEQKGFGNMASRLELRSCSLISIRYSEYGPLSYLNMS